MEHDRYMHLPFARGRIEAGLPPAPLRDYKRPWRERLAEAWKVWRGEAVAVNTHAHLDRNGSEGTLENHRLIPRALKRTRGRAFN